MIYDLMRLYTRHFVAGCVHLAAFAFLLGFAAHRADSLSEYSDQFWFIKTKMGLEPRYWRWRCGPTPCCEKEPCDSALPQCVPITSKCSFDASSKYWTPETPNIWRQRFFVTEPPGAVNVNVLALACLYVLWSSAGHFVVWYTNNYHRVYKWFDYVVTAPVMLSTLALVYGCDSLLAVVLMPVVLALLIVVAAFCERTDKDTIVLSSGQGVVIVLLVVVYAGVLVPLLSAAWLITRDVDPVSKYVGKGTAPIYVFVFAAVTVLVFFSSFAVLYVFDAFVRPLEWREAGYITLSMISKTALHLFIGLTVVESIATVDTDGSDPRKRSDMGTLTVGLGGAAGLVVGLTIFNIWGGMYDDSKPNQTYSKLEMSK